MISLSLLVQILLLADEGSERLTALATVALAAITLLLACGTAILAFYTFKLWKATQQLAVDANDAAELQGKRTDAALRLTEESNRLSREALVADQRAWLSLSATLVGGFTWDSSGHAHFAIAFTLHNFGKTPALQAWVDARVDVLGRGPTAPATEFYPELSRDAHDHWLAIPGLSLPIYPGREATLTRGMMVVSSQIDAAYADTRNADGSPVPRDEQAFSISVLACALYVLAVGDSNDPKETGLSIQIDRQANNQRLAILRNGRNLSGFDLIVTPEVGGKVTVS